MSGGTTTSATMSGGYIELGGGNGVGSGGVVTFAGGGYLKLDDSIHFNGLVAGFGIPGSIDLADIAFTSNTTSGFVEAGNNTSGTLTVSDGTQRPTSLCLAATSPASSIWPPMAAAARWSPTLPSPSPQTSNPSSAARSMGDGSARVAQEAECARVYFGATAPVSGDSYCVDQIAGHVSVDGIKQPIIASP